MLVNTSGYENTTTRKQRASACLDAPSLTHMLMDIVHEAPEPTPTMPTCPSCGHRLAATYVLIRREYYSSRAYVLCPCRQHAFSYKVVSPIVDALVQEANS